MRNRQIYELTFTRSRRKDSMESDFSTYTGQTLNISQINQSERPKYFEDIDNQDAPFSHNTIISKQIEYRCMSGDYIQFCDQFLQLKNENILTFEINNQNSISIFVNIKIVESSEVQGLWISQEIAQTYNSDVFFIECYITTDINEQNRNLIFLSKLLADELFLTCQSIQQFNQFISIFKRYNITFQEIIIAELEQYDLDQSQLSEFLDICQYIKYVNGFPTNIIDFQWQYYDFKHQNCKLIPQKQWKGYFIDSSMFLFMVQIMTQFILDYSIITDILLDIIYAKIFEKLIDNSFDVKYAQFENNIHQKITPDLPMQNLHQTLIQMRTKIQEDLYDELYKFRNHSYFRICLHKMLEKLNILEQQTIQLNEQIIDCFSYQKITEYINETYSHKIYHPSSLQIDNCANEIELIFNKFFQLLSDKTEQIIYENIFTFFKNTYKPYLQDIISKIVDIQERKLNKYLDVLRDQINQLMNQRIIIEEKAICIQYYNSILRKEIESLQKQILNTELQNQKLEPQYQASQKCIAQLHSLEVQMFQFNLQKIKIEKKKQKK